jgi:hypothetical protein
MAYTIKPLSCDPTKLVGLSEKLIRSHYENNYGGPDPIATMQADAQDPHESPMRAGEARVIDWNPGMAAGTYIVRATLVYDLKRYNDRAFKDDQQEIARISIPVKITRPANVSRFGNPAALAKGIALAQRPRNRDLADSR